MKNKEQDIQINYRDSKELPILIVGGGWLFLEGFPDCSVLGRPGLLKLMRGHTDCLQHRG